MSASLPFDVEAWLKDLGLAVYVPAFRDNDVDGEVLRALTGDDLRDLGVTSVGHRRRILDTAARLGGTAATAAPTPASAPPAPAAEARPSAVAERRHLTVMFCDLMDSTALSTQTDPEDYREFIARYRTALEEAIKPHHGYVAQYMGDGVLVYFGYPTSSGQDAENAVEAALAIVRHVGALKPLAGGPPRVRIGIASGLTIVGATDRMRELQGDSAVGETPNLGARLQALASANAIVISASTRALLGELYDCRDLGAVELKGFDRPVPAWQVLGRGAGTDRFLASRTGRPDAGFVGRGAELGQLRQRLAAARAGRGQVAIVAGEAGLGKSRLARQILDEAGTGGRARILQCTSYNVGTPFHPLRYRSSALPVSRPTTRPESPRASSPPCSTARAFRRRNDWPCSPN